MPIHHIREGRGLPLEDHGKTQRANLAHQARSPTRRPRVVPALAKPGQEQSYGDLNASSSIDPNSNRPPAKLSIVLGQAAGMWRGLPSAPARLNSLLPMALLRSLKMKLHIIVRRKRARIAECLMIAPGLRAWPLLDYRPNPRYDSAKPTSRYDYGQRTYSKEGTRNAGAHSGRRHRLLFARGL
jgi:hypothetical protein